MTAVEKSLLTVARERFREAANGSSDWRREAEEDFAFVAGDQWAAEDKATLEEQLRPIVTFNRIGPIIDAVVGQEVQNRTEVKLLPREAQDSGPTDVLSNAITWVRDQCDAEGEESDAFMDMVVCGLGWTEQRLDYDQDLDGKIIVERTDPLEVFHDPAARKRNLTDARYLFRVKDLDEEEVKAMWPDKADEIVDTRPVAWSTARDNIVDTNSLSPDEYANPDKQGWDQSLKDMKRVIEYQWWEREAVYRVPMPDGKVEAVPAADYEKIRERLESMGVKSVKQQQRKYKRAFFCGDTILEDGDSPCQAGFTYSAITGKRDRNNNTWYGLVRGMKDPQRWSNKFFSTIQHILATNPQGGIMAEKSAIDDVQEFETNWSRPDKVQLLADGALTGGQVQPKPMGQYPAGVERLLEYAMAGVRETSGVNAEMLGMREAIQPGVLEYQRRQAGIAILATMFDSLRRYRKEQGRILVHMIQTYISDGRLIRIDSLQGPQFVQLAKLPDTLRYDVIVDEAPTSPNQKEKVFQILMQLLPSLKDMGIPLPPDLLDFSPLPTALAQAWKRQIAEGQQQQLPPEVQQQMQQLQQELEKLQAENVRLKTQEQVQMRKAELDSQGWMAQIEAQYQAKLKDIENDALADQKRFALEQWKTAATLELQRERQRGEMALRAQQQRQQQQSQTEGAL